MLTEQAIEQIIIYGAAFLFCGLVVWLYLRKEKKTSRIVAAKIEQAKEEGLHEPVSLHPRIDLNTCIKSGACVEACPEKDILGIINGGGALINASNCVGHGACFHACPVEAISLVIGTEKRGVELPHVNENYETNVEGIYIAGELGGMGLIRNCVEQGQMAVENIAKSGLEKIPGVLDLVIVGAGPAGISASLTAKQHGLDFLTLEQDTLGGTVYSFPRAKIVMTQPMYLPLYGKVKLYDTTKDELLALWNDALSKNGITIKEQCKVESIEHLGRTFKVVTSTGETFETQTVLLAIGRRGTPRKLGVPGEELPKVYYRLLDPERIVGKDILVVGGGDSAIESALLLCDQNRVSLSYRRDAFSRLKVKNRERIKEAMESGRVRVIFNSNVLKIETDKVHLKIGEDRTEVMPNDLVYVFIGGELPTQFLQKVGIEITKRFGYTVRKHAS
ncbi:MAG: hypothetical protein KatS3mg029_0171 [Saprospiraceae bacterium]|nr:MAG: hypothetical protein KatS3mg029_0171 [Saprospiraceae bacterium]